MVDLQTLFQSDPAAQELGLKQFGMDQNINQARLAQMLQEQQQNAQMFPGKLQQQSLQNDQMGAQLPGIRALSSLNEDKANLSRNTMAQQLEAAMKEHKGKMTKADLDELNSTGQIYSQAGALLGAVPGPARKAAAKQILGDKYRPEFDQYDPNDLADTVSTIGKWMTEAGSKYKLETDKIDMKAQAAAEAQAKKIQATKELEVFKASLKEKLDGLKSSGDPKTYEAVIVQLKKAAAQETDPEKRQAILQEAQDFINIQHGMKIAGAGAAQAGKVDVGAATGMQTNPVPQPPMASGGMVPQTAPKAPQIKTIQDLQSMYPGVPPEKLRELYKKKFGVDLQ
jgi:hypothetical protein